MARKATGMKPGRPPSGYTTEIMEEVIRQVAAGASLRAVCAKEGMPREETFRKWVRENPVLQRKWLEAKEYRSHSLFDHMTDLAQQLEDNAKAVTATEINAIKIAIETYKHAAGRLNPRDYGERVPANPVIPIQIVTTLNLGQQGPAEKLDGNDIWRVKVPQQKVIDVTPDG